MQKVLPVKTICVVGDHGVGKSSIIMRYCQDKVTPIPVAISETLGVTTTRTYTEAVEIIFREVAIELGKVTDCEFQNNYAYIVVADFTSVESLKNVETWINTFKELHGEIVPFQILINKTDIEATYNCTKMLCLLESRYNYDKDTLYYVSTVDPSRIGELRYIIDRLLAS